MDVSVLGAGVAGLCCATALAERGLTVEVIDPDPDPRGASWYAGGMLAPDCESESAPAEVVRLGRDAAQWWAARVPGVMRHGTLVVAPPRDTAETRRFARLTANHRRLDAAAIAALEPDLAGRFETALFYEDEAHLDPRAAMTALMQRLRAHGVVLRFGTGGAPHGRRIVDCRGLTARDALPDLRAVRGEMMMVETPDLSLSRVVRLLHPRFPLYVVPREDQRFMIGATMVESDDPGPITARSAMELLGALYAVHPAFAEARVVELGAGLRPAFPDNIPAIREAGGRLHVNGLYRHGFLSAPALAEDLARRLTNRPAEIRPPGSGAAGPRAAQTQAGEVTR